MMRQLKQWQQYFFYYTEANAQLFKLGLLFHAI